jgi:hypothetical protein
MAVSSASAEVRLKLPADVQAHLGDPDLLTAMLLADSMAWPASFRDLMETPYRIYMLAIAVRTVRSQDRESR